MVNLYYDSDDLYNHGSDHILEWINLQTKISGESIEKIGEKVIIDLVLLESPLLENVIKDITRKTNVDNKLIINCLKDKKVSEIFTEKINK